MHCQSLSKEQIDKFKIWATYAGVSVAVLLSGLKIFGAVWTDSLAILSSVVDSFSDVIASLVSFFAIRISTSPATKEHRYGYGKAECLSALFQSAFIAGSGLFVLYDGINRFFYPKIIEQTSVGILIMIISLIMTIGLVIFQRYVYKITKSQAIIAESSHYTVDILSNLAIIGSLFIVGHLGLNWADSIIAVCIALYLLFNAYQIARGAIENLLDKELDSAIRHKIKDIVLKHPFALGIHDLRTRDLGGMYIFEFHLEMDGKIRLNEAHANADKIEQAILEAYPNSQTIIHQEPHGITECRLDWQLKRKK